MIKFRKLAIYNSNININPILLLIIIELLDDIERPLAAVTTPLQINLTSAYSNNAFNRFG